MQSRLKRSKGTSPPKRLPPKRAGIRGESRRDETSRLRDDWRGARRRAQSHAQRSTFVSGRNGGSPLGAHPSRVGKEAQAIMDRVKALGSDQLHDRYHELVDQRLQGMLGFIELFELERVEARLDAEDQGEAARLTIFRDDWRRERNELVASIEHLLARFKTAS